MQRVALITGIRGQDGGYLAELLAQKGYEVHGVCRPAAPGEAAHDLRDAPTAGADRISVHRCDVRDAEGMGRLIARVRPTEVYNLAAQSHVQASFEQPRHTAEVVALAAVGLLELLRTYRDRSGVPVRFYQASSSEMFGKARTAPQNEQTPFRPTSPYAAAKLHAHWQTVLHREAYGMHACCGILYNHESPRRPANYVLPKIARAAARIRLGLDAALTLGNLDARRDWGFAGDYVEAMWRMLQRSAPDDYVIASGRTHSIRDVLDAAFGAVALDWRQHVSVDERLYRPAEPTLLCGDASKAAAELGWRPRVDFAALVWMLVAAELRRCRPHRRHAVGDACV